MNRPLFLAMAWTLLILIACSIPGHELPPDTLSHFDKVAHFCLFFGFGWLWLQAYPHLSERTMWYVAAAGIGYAVFTEVYQHLMPIGRSGDPLDALADSIGVIAGVLLHRLWWQYRGA